MTSSHLETVIRTLRARIPVIDYLDLAVTDARSECVRVEAPLAPSVNHRGTAFGPNVLTVAALATWLRVVLNVQREARPARVLLRSCEFSLLRPIATRFWSECSEVVTWSLDPLVRGDRVQLRLTTVVGVGTDCVGRYTGHFVLVPALDEGPEIELGR